MTPRRVSTEPDPVLTLGLSRIGTEFAPLVDLETNLTVAYAAAHSASIDGSFLESAPFASAVSESGHAAAVDALSRASAVGAANTGQLSPRGTVFTAPTSTDLIHAADDEIALSNPMVLEISGRAIDQANPVRLLRAIAKLRAHGWGICISGIGPAPHSLALLPLIDPDVIKISVAAVRNSKPEYPTDTLNSLGAHVESTDCVILVDDIETSADVTAARAIGAELGQGPFFGRPKALPFPRVHTSGIRIRPIKSPMTARSDTPFAILSERRESRPASRELILNITRTLEKRAETHRTPTIIMATFQHARNIRKTDIDRYVALTQTSAAVMMFANEIGTISDAENFASVSFDSSDPLTHEWNVILISTSFSAVLTARQIGSDSNDAFEFIFSRDRRLTVDAARTLTARL